MWHSLQLAAVQHQGVEEDHLGHDGETPPRHLHPRHVEVPPASASGHFSVSMDVYCWQPIMSVRENMNMILNVCFGSA